MTHQPVPIKYLRPMAYGKSQPHLIKFSDHRKYVVKFKNNVQGNRVLISEYIVNKLAALLDLPVPPCKAVTVPDSFIRRHPPLSESHFQSGTQFASRYIDRCISLFDILPRPLKEEIVNRKQAAGLIVFDLWVSNRDRNSKNILLKPVGERRYALHMIDHANCIKRSGNVVQFKRFGFKYNFAYRWCISILDDGKELLPYVKKIVALPNEDIYDVIRSIPDDWNVTENEKKNLFRHLKDAKTMLPHLVEEFTAKYMNGESK